MTNLIFKLTLFSILISAFALPNFFVLGEEVQENLEEICEEISQTEQKPENISDEEYKSLLGKCEIYYQKKSEEIEKDITKTRQEKKTLQNEIYILRNKIKKLDNEIYQSNLMIKDLGLQIKDTTGSIQETSLKIDDSQENLVNLLRTIYEEDQKSIVEILLSENKLSDFFNNLVALEALSDRNKELLVHIKDLKLSLETQKESLDSEKNDLENVVVVRSLQKQENAAVKKQQEYLLTKTKGEEALYQKHLKEVQARAQEIMKRSLRMIGVAEAPSFGEAIEITKHVGNLVGVRPAFLLAIISQESAIGRNVGQCYVTNKTTGAGIYKSGKPIKRIMNNTRDLPIFLEITGDNFSKTPVSCWIPDCVKPWSSPKLHCRAFVDSQGNPTCEWKGYVLFGFGGAMGPAQFIPSTWNGIKDRVQKIIGRVPNPWNITDAFAASALYLRDLGAGAQTTQKEMSAASRYYGGSYSYASQVLTRATCIQNFIDNGTMSSACENLIF
jgi:peptidoglycan hydrolase CwlO-like protein